MDNNNEYTEQNQGSSNYELKSEAVEDLVSEEIPEYSEEELKRYRSKGRFHIPEAVKILFIKAWFSGAVCFFFYWGLGNYIGSTLDMLFIVCIVQGMVTDLLCNNVIRFIAPTRDEYDKWLLVRAKGMLGFFLNLIYGFVISICVFLLYMLINFTAESITGSKEAFYLGVEPVLYGIFCMGFDMLFVGMKRLIIRIFGDAKSSAA